GSESRRADWPRRPNCAARVNWSRRSWLDLFALPWRTPAYLGRCSRRLAARIEVPAQALPALALVVLPLLEVGPVLRRPLPRPGLEHERDGVGELHRLELAVARTLESGLIRSVRQHAIVERDAAGHEALGFGVVDAVDEPHEFRHQVAVIPRRPEGIFRHLPAF